MCSVSGLLIWFSACNYHMKCLLLVSYFAIRDLSGTLNSYIPLWAHILYLLHAVLQNTLYLPFPVYCFRKMSFFRIPDIHILNDETANAFIDPYLSFYVM